MSKVTVKQLSEVVGAPVERLLEQLKEAGIEADNADTEITDEQKIKLLDHLRSSHGKNDAASGGKSKITLKRKTSSELRAGGSKTVNVEVRKKRTFSKSGEVDDAKEKEKAEIQRLIAEKEAREAERQQAEEEAIQRSRDAAKQRELDEQAKQQAEQEARKQAEEKSLNKKDEKPVIAEPIIPDVVEGKQDKGRKKKSRKDEDKNKSETRYGRKELHIASGKGGGRSKKPHRKDLAADNAAAKHAFEKPVAKMVYDVDVPETIKVSDLAARMSMKAAELIKIMMKMGVMATINQVIDQETAILIVEEVIRPEPRLLMTAKTFYWPMPMKSWVNYSQDHRW